VGRERCVSVVSNLSVLTFLCPTNIYWVTHRVDRDRIYVFACTLRYFYPMLIRTGIFRRILAKLHKFEFHNGPSSESPGVTCEQTGVRTDTCWAEQVVFL